MSAANVVHGSLFARTRYTLLRTNVRSTWGFTLCEAIHLFTVLLQLLPEPYRNSAISNTMRTSVAPSRWHTRLDFNASEKHVSCRVWPILAWRAHTIHALCCVDVGVLDHKKAHEKWKLTPLVAPTAWALGCSNIDIDFIRGFAMNLTVVICAHCQHCQILWEPIQFWIPQAKKTAT